MAAAFVESDKDSAKSTTSLTVTLSGINSGDLIVAGLGLNGSRTVTHPSGYSKIGPASGFGLEIHAAYLFAGASEDTTPTWSWTTGLACNLVVCRYTGLDAYSSDFDGASSIGADNITVPDLGGTIDGDGLKVAMAWQNSGNAFVSATNGFGLRAESSLFTALAFCDELNEGTAESTTITMDDSTQILGAAFSFTASAGGQEILTLRQMGY